MIEAPRVFMQVFVPFAIALGLAACGDGRPAQQSVEGPVASKVKDDPVVATVDGTEIHASSLRDEIQRSGAPPRRALRALLRRAALAKEALRRTLGDRWEVRDATRRQLATTLIHTVFGPTATKAAIPLEIVKRAYRLNKVRYVRPEVVKVKHLLCSANRRSTEAQRRGAERCIGAALKLTDKPLTAAEFEALPEQLKKIAAPSLVRVQTLTTPQRGYTVQPFADAAFALTKAGQMSRKVSTRYGYHIIYLLERSPARHRSFAQAEREVRDRIFEEATAIRFDRWAKALAKRHRAKRDLVAWEKALRVSHPRRRRRP